jgi:SAM-dependent methyltransferase
VAGKEQEYLLGVNQTEFERLRFQHGVWKGVTEGFLDRIGVASCWRCLDVGGGPGFVAMDLRDRVGEGGQVTLLEPSRMYLDWFKNETELRSWKNVRTIHGSAELADIPKGAFDLIFVRWVIAFVADPEAFIQSLVPALAADGVIAFQDYYYEGLSLFPHGGAYDEMPQVVRAYYRSGGGDPYIAGRIPAILRSHGLRIIDYTPHSLAGGPESAIMEWGHRFFVSHIPLMAKKGLISGKQADALLADWHAHRKNPDALFFTPMVVDVAGRLPGKTLT